METPKGELAGGSAPIRWGRRLALIGLLPLAFAVRGVAATAPDTVERFFSQAVYPVLGGRVACLTAWLPFSLGEAVVMGLVAGACYWLARLVWRVAWRRISLGVGVGLFFVDVLAVAGVAYAAFLALWGLNHQRQAFAVSAGLDTRPAPASELEGLCEELVVSANRLRQGLSEDDSGVLSLDDGPRGALERTAAGLRIAAREYRDLGGPCARPKPVLASGVLSRLGIAGLYFPFTGEANVNVALPAPYLPFSACHELAHLRGFAREDEASFLGYVACSLHPDPDFRYSASLAASSQALRALAGVAPEAARGIAGKRSAAVRRDVKALAEWVERHRSRATEVSQRVNDVYLRAQGTKDGVASYGRMVDLLVARRRAREAGLPEEGA